MSGQHKEKKGREKSFSTHELPFEHDLRPFRANFS